MAIVKKYSDYVRYPIQMEREKSRQKPEPDPKPDDYKPEWETYTELETLNSMVPIWKKQKSEVTDEEYASFYKDKFNDYSDPARVIVSRTEGTANYNALLFVPSHRPYDFYTKAYEKGLAPVSYTQLDVYKRQGQRSAQCCGSCTVPQSGSSRQGLPPSTRCAGVQFPGRYKWAAR